MRVYLRTKSQMPSIILTSFRYGGNFTQPPPTSKRTPKKSTQIRVNIALLTLHFINVLLFDIALLHVALFNVALFRISLLMLHYFNASLLAVALFDVALFFVVAAVVYNG